MNKFSIIIPAYNGEMFLNRCLKSVLTQTYKDFEIIIVDDGSTDKTPEIADNYSKKYNNIKVIHQKNLGISEARNNGIKNANGEYVVFLDCDDELQEELLNKINNQISTKKQVDIIRYNAEKFDFYGNKLNDNSFVQANNIQCSGKEALKHFLSDNDAVFCPAWLYCFNKNFINENAISFPKNRFHEDIGCIPVALAKAKRIVLMDFCGYKYYCNEKSVMNNHDKEFEFRKFKDMVFIYNQLLEEFNILNIPLEIRALLGNYLSRYVIHKCMKLDPNDRSEAKNIILSNKINLGVISRKKGYEISFPNVSTKDGLIIKGVEYLPNQQGPRCVIFVPGAAGNFIENDFIEKIATGFARFNVGFICAHNRGSFTINNVKKTSDYRPQQVGSANENMLDSKFDIDAWVSYAKQKGYKEITFIGHSLGNDKICQYLLNTDRTSDIGAVIMCSPIEFVDRIKKYDGFRETFREACENVKNNEPKKLVQCQWIIKTSETFVDLIKSDAGEVGYITSDKFVKLKNQGVPLFIISGEKDLASLKFFDNIKKQDVLVERTIIADTSHNFTGKENELAQELTKAFLKLKSPHTKFVPLKKGLEN